MMNFIEALQSHLGYKKKVNPIPINVLGNQITLIDEHIKLGFQNEYHLQLNWYASIWLPAQASDYEVEEARKNAMKELTRVVYADIFVELSQLKYMIKYCEIDKAIELIDNAMKKIGMGL